MPKQKLPDYQFENYGTIYLVRSNTKKALRHLRSHTSEDAQWMGWALAVESRFAGSLAESLTDDGYSVG